MRKVNVEVSVVIPVYNGEQYILRAVESVLSQKGVLFELIVVDDFSADSTVDILESIKDHRITILRHSNNRGQSAARNYAVKNSNGTYVCFLDSDDEFVDDSSLRLWVIDAIESDADICKVRNEIFNSGVINVSHEFPKSVCGVFDDVFAVPEILCTTACWQLLYRKEFLIDNQIYFSELLKQREDRLFFLEAILKSKKVYISNRLAVRYHVRGNSTMRTLNLTQLGYFNKHLELLKILVAEYIGIKAVFFEYFVQFYLMHYYSYWQDFVSANLESEEVRKYFEHMKGLVLMFPIDLNSRLPLVKSNNEWLGVVESHLIFKHLSYTEFKSIKAKRYADIDNFIRSVERETDPNLRDSYNRCFDRLVKLKPVALPYERSFRLILHIGLPKTGTSFFQKFLEINRCKLLEREGVYYPFSGLEHGSGGRFRRTSGHALLVSSILNNEMSVLEELWSEIDSLNTPPRTVVLSCENVLSHRFWNQGTVLERLSTAFGIDNSMVIVTLRPQLDWFESMYKEMVFSPGYSFRGTFKEFVVEYDFSFMNYSLLVDSIKENFFEYKVLDYNKDSIIDQVTRESGYQMPELELANVSSRIFDVVLKSSPMDYSQGDFSVSGLDESDAVLYDVDDLGFIDSKYGESNSKLLLEEGVDIPPFFPESLDKALRYNVYDLFEAHLPGFLSWVRKNERHDLVSAESSVSWQLKILVQEVMSKRLLFRLIISGAFRRQVKNAFTIAVSGLVDVDYCSRYRYGGSICLYLSMNPNEKPNVDFDPKRYLAFNEDVKQSGEHPLVHYIRFGVSEGRVF